MNNRAREGPEGTSRLHEDVVQMPMAQSCYTA
jgi:hypothetical protein